MVRKDSCRAQNRLSQPTHAEQQQQNAHRELEAGQRNGIQEGAEHEHGKRKKREAREGAQSCRAPAADSDDGEHDGECFYRFDNRSDEGGRDRWRGGSPRHHGYSRYELNGIGNRIGLSGFLAQ